ncbi:MAG: CsoS2 family carboxysome shell protein [Gammaproteobacteria bacterium]
MSQVATANANSTRELALARRRALSTSGKSALKSTDRILAQGAVAKAAASPVPGSSITSVTGGSARSAALARRKAMSTHGKSGVASQDRTRTAPRQQASATGAPDPEPQRGCGCGCGGIGRGEDGARNAATGPEAAVSNSPLDASTTEDNARRSSRARRIRPVKVAAGTARTAALARRKATSSRGKAGLANSSMSEAQAARAGNPKLSGRELARVIREQRSRRGGAGQKKSAPCGRVRKPNEATAGAAQDAPWKVGTSMTTSGQTVTGTMVGRNAGMTGDEPSTCRTITGTEYLGADIFSKFCQSDAKTTTARKVTVTTTSHGNPVSGNRMGRAGNVTGNEPGTCKRVTGGEYASAEQTQGYCGEPARKSPRKVSMAETMKGKAVTGNNVGRSKNVTGDEYGMRRHLTGTQYTKPADIGNAAPRVGVSSTLRGGSVTGIMVGRREHMTGDEAGSCRNVTGDDYVGKEQFSNFCATTPHPEDRKVGFSQTLRGLMVTGSLAGRSRQVTGDEPGTCEAVTGTPYAGGDQYHEFCEPGKAGAAQARMQGGARIWGKPMTGQQPGIGGNLTGAAKGVCEPVTGTPYVGADQAIQACPATAAEPGSPDFPQSLGQTPWGDFSLTPPAHAAHYDMSPQNVTGMHSETGQITGPFGMAAGKVTGTKQARFDRPQAETVPMPFTAGDIEGRVKSRITGEGMDAGSRITGDDWERGDHVTGTEGASATRRNQTLRGGMMSAMQLRKDMVRPEDVPVPVSKVTGGSGNTEKGALITYSGGARG